MKFRFTLGLIFLTALVTGCATKPQMPIDFPKDFTSAKVGKIGVAMAQLPQVSTEFPGADCLLCLAAASIANQGWTTHIKTLTSDDLTTLKIDLAKLLRAKGLEVTIVDEFLNLKDLPDATTAEKNFSKRDFSTLKSKYNVDKLLVVEVTALGAWRNYSSYIPSSDPFPILKGMGYIVNLNNNAFEWYENIDERTSSDQKWDEPPKFPGLTNAYYQVIENSKVAFTKPFQ